LSSLAGRLAALAGRLEPDDRAKVREIAGRDLQEIARSLLDSIDPDVISAEASRRGQPSEGGRAEVAKELKEHAARAFDDPKLRRLLKELKAQSEIVIDEISTDEVLTADYDLKRAEETTAKFKKFLEENRDELTALQVIYGRPYALRRLTYAAIKELVDAMSRPPWLLSPPAVWASYRRLDRARVRDASPERLLTDVIALVRFALGQNETLEPFVVDVERRFNLWLGREQKAGRVYTDGQKAWLDLIKAHVAANAEITLEDVQHAPAMGDRGGRLAAAKAFGGPETLKQVISDLNEALVA
jgi:type I restriction enzyme R subunit